MDVWLIDLIDIDIHMGGVERRGCGEYGWETGYGMGGAEGESEVERRGGREGRVKACRCDA